jgi:hypothetical protein
MTQRTDIHRPSEIVPHDYEFLCSFATGTTDSPSWNIKETIVHRQRAQREGKAIYGAPGNCGTCGAWFIEGDLWRHVPTGELVYFGHQCADNLELYSTEQRRARFAISKGRKRARENAKRQEKREAFLAEHEGLAEALKADHYIVADIDRKLDRYGSISDKQIALVQKIVREEKERAERKAVEDARPKARAAEGRREITGTILSVKWQESPYRYGSSLKQLVEVTEQDGSVWRAWGTVPAAIDEVQKGAVVAFTATFKPADDPDFAFYSRPTKARVVQDAPEEG